MFVKKKIDYLLDFYYFRRSALEPKLIIYIDSLRESIEKIDDDHVYFFWKPETYHDDVYGLISILRMIYNEWPHETVLKNIISYPYE